MESRLARCVTAAGPPLVPKSVLPPHVALTCALLPGALTAAECATLVAALEHAGFHATGAGYPPSYRDNDRLVVDDPSLAARLFARLGDQLPVTVVDDDGVSWRLVGLNERFRACRYEGSQRFSLHRDGAFARPTTGEAQECCERSFLVVMMYLQAGEDGGETRFVSGPEPAGSTWAEVQPRAGDVVAFDHRLWHEGRPVHGGVKIVLRTDVMYARATSPLSRPGHAGYVLCSAATDADEVITGGRDGTVRRWSRGLDAGVVVLTRPGSVTAVATDDAGEVWTGARTGAITRGDVVIGAHEGAVLCLRRLEDGRMASGGGDGVVRLWTADGPAGLLAATDRRADGGWVWALAEIRPGVVVAGGEDGALRTWDLASGRCTAVRALDGGSVRSLAVWRGDVVATTADGAVHVGGQVERLHEGACTAVVMAGDVIVSGGEDGAVVAWDPSTGDRTTLGTHRDFVTCLANLGDDIVSGGYDGAVRAWQLPVARAGWPR